jgi:hypothetical protein
MRLSILSVLLVGCALAGCGQQTSVSGPGPSKSPGRYSGIGTYPTGRLWQQAAEAADPSDAAIAKLGDDENVIVVIDSHTGEVRQCGDHSGFCVTMNPWAAQGGRTSAPVKLHKHAADLEAKDGATNAAEPTVKTADQTQ